MSKYKTKTDENLKEAKQLLQDAYDRIEGRYSNIPGCCIEVFVAGRTYQEFKQELASQKDKLKLEEWSYVPCDSCFKANRKNKINKNGRSEIGYMLLTIMQILEEKQKDQPLERVK